MKKRILIVLVIIIAILIIFWEMFFDNKNDEEQKLENGTNIDNSYDEIDKNQVSYQENSTVEDIKNDTGITGNSDIYEVQTEYDGRKVLNVKADIKYKVAFAGMIKGNKPDMSKIDYIYNSEKPEYNGIWIHKESRNKILDILKSKTNSKYIIDDKGYLKVESKGSQNDNDKIIESAINGDKQFIWTISSTCYIVDDVTGEIIDYCFEDIDKYQNYEYFEDNGKVIVFISENTKGALDYSSVFDNIIKLIKL